MTIAFNKDIYVVKNLTAIDSQVLGLKIIPGAESNLNDLNITSWNVTKMEQRKIIINIITITTNLYNKFVLKSFQLIDLY